MTTPELLVTLDEIAALQGSHSFLLSGIYLNEDQLNLIQPLLDPDDPPIGACGRLQRTPIFLDSAPRLFSEHPHGIHKGISYSYIKMREVFSLES